MSPTARSIFFSALLAGMAGCATSPAPQTTTDADAGADAPQYYRGLESEYVVPLSSLPQEKGLPEDSVMRDAMLSGDQDVYVSAALFRKDDMLCMDLIVLNHANDAIQIGREDLKLVDGEGRFLDAAEDFEGADELGLRSRRKRGEKRLPAVAPPEWSAGTGTSGLGDLGAGEAKSHRLPTARPMPDSASLTDWGQLSTQGESGAPNVPAQIRVDSEQGRAYWAYWHAGEALNYPLTAFVTMDERHLRFQFEAP